MTRSGSVCVRQPGRVSSELNALQPSFLRILKQSKPIAIGVVSGLNRYTWWCLRKCLGLRLAFIKGLGCISNNKTTRKCPNSQNWSGANLSSLSESLKIQNLKSPVGMRHFVEILQKFLTVWHLVYFRSIFSLKSRQQVLFITQWSVASVLRTPHIIIIYLRLP